MENTESTSVQTESPLSEKRGMLCCVGGLYFRLCRFAERFAAPLVDLGMRLFMANVFWSSGILKYKDWVNNDFRSTLLLFEYEHPVPYIPVEMAAYMATAGELILPVLLVLGLGTRFGAAGMLIMTAVIELTYKHFDIHLVWALLLLAILVRGGGKLSLDYLIKRKCCG